MRVALIAFLLIESASAMAQPYRDPTRGWSVDVPSGWSAMDRGVLDEMESAARSRMPGMSGRFVAGFATSRGVGGGAPYILVIDLPGTTTGATYEQVELSFNARNMERSAAQMNENLTGLMSGVSFGDAVLDRSRNRVVSVATMNLADIGTVKGLTVSHLTSSGIIQVNCYAKETELEPVRPAFDHVIESFQLRPGDEFTPITASTGSAARTGSATGMAIGLGVLIVAALLMARRAKGVPSDR